MSTFTPNELTYLSEQRIGRPHVVPTGFNIDGEEGVAEIGGHTRRRSAREEDRNGQ